ncbi:caspase, EACC1-associated type [Streptomyces mayonensis]|uniref:caspase, EACC1-associated type n=1 Tax=Streptomyces mayonensis TaxID=2750816 RepID=UPI001C1DF1CA|nr:glycine betaine ABC transporter substrate-binding protein [Streptomyces sp. A108]MBU6531875.1 caspase family protein [Streptomyces sp. A108]
MGLLPDATGSRAVLIGTSRYTHLDDLPAVANNLAGLSAVLRGDDSWRLAEEHCTVVADPGDWTEVLHAVRAAAEEATDTLLVYFAGHGLLEETRGDLFLGLPDSQQGRSYTGVPYDALRDVVLTGRPRRHVVILDCCFSGRALGTMNGTGAIADQAEIEGSYLLAASPETSFALAPRGETYTAFTGELLRLLEDGVPDGPELLDLDSVYTALRASLRAKGRPLPQKRDRNTAGRLALSRNTARPGAARAPAPRGTPADPAPRTAAPKQAGGPPAAPSRPVPDHGGAAPGTTRKRRGWVPVVAGLTTFATLIGGMTWYAKADKDDDGPVITLGYVDRDEGKAVAYLWRELLERRGYRPRLEEPEQDREPSELFAEQAEGSVDLQAGARLPGDSAHLEQDGGGLEDFGPWFRASTLQVVVPGYVEGVETIADLGDKNPWDGWLGPYGSTAQREPDESSAVCEKELASKYEVAFDSHSAALSEQESPSDLTSAYEGKRPTAALLRFPHWEFTEYELTTLEDPEDVLDCGNQDFHVMGRKGFTQQHPQVAKWLKDFRLTGDQLGSLEYAVHGAEDADEDPKDAVRGWLDRNLDVVDKLAK